MQTPKLTGRPIEGQLTSAPEAMVGNSSAVCDTAGWAAATRHLAMQAHPAVFGNCDPYAACFISADDLKLAREYEVAKRIKFAETGRTSQPEDFYYVAWRSQVIDRLILARLGRTDALARGVLLGAGLDSRAWRLPFPSDFTLHEFDTGVACSRKTSSTRDPPRCRRVQHILDLARPGWTSALGQTPVTTLWVAEGLTYYLSPSTLGALVTSLTAVSTDGSAIIFDTHVPVPESFAAQQQTAAIDAFARFWSVRGVVKQSDWSHLEAVLHGAGWRVTARHEHQGASMVAMAELMEMSP